MDNSLLSADEDLLVPRPGDVYIIAYPKSGITWLTEIVSFIYKAYSEEAGEEGKAFGDAVKVHGFCDICPMSRRKSRKNLASDSLAGFDISGDSVIMEKSDLRKRIIGLHFTAERMKQLSPDLFNCDGVKVIYVARNVTDVAVSYFHFHEMNKALETPESWDEFFEDFSFGKLRWGSWFEHIKGWWREFQKLKNQKKMLWLTFEEMKKDLSLAVRKVSSFIGVGLSEDGVAMVAKCSHFQNMKKDPRRLQRRDSIHAADFMRKGVVGDGKKYFSQIQNNLTSFLMRGYFQIEYDVITNTFPLHENQLIISKRHQTRYLAVAAILFLCTLLGIALAL